MSSALHHAWPALLFTAGLLTGVLWREAYELFRRKDELMHLRLLLRIHRTALLMWALIVSMIFTGIVGVAVIINDNGRDELVRCVTMYNEQAGKARDERNVAVDKAAAAELDYVREDLRYQQGLLDALEEQRGIDSLIGTIRTRVEANQRYLRTLQDQQEVRAAADYPAPDFCEAAR